MSTRWRTPLGLLVRLATARPVVTVLLSVLAAAASLFYASRELGFLTSGRDMLPQGEAYVQRDAEYNQEFPNLDPIVVAIAGPTVAEQAAFAHRLEQELRRLPRVFARVSYRLDERELGGRALLYLPTGELTELRDRILDHRDALTAVAAQPTLDQLIDTVRTEIVSAFVSHALDLGLDDEGADPAVDLGSVRALLDRMHARLDGRATGLAAGPLLPFATRFEEESHFRSHDGRLLFVMVEPQEGDDGFTEHESAIDTLRATVARLRPEFPAIDVGVTGAPALSNDEMVSAFGDSETSTVLAAVLTLVLLVAAFRRAAMPILMLGALALSLCWAIGVATLVIGHLSIFSVMFISIVIGIGIDYGIYFLYRDQEELGRGMTPREAVELAAVRSGPGMLFGALTAAGTFFALYATDFPGVQELGVISGTAILLAWLCMMTLLPALSLLVDRRRAHRGVPARASRFSGHDGVPLIEWLSGRPRAVIAVAAVATALSLLAVPGLRFDYNLLNLQAAGTESVRWERRIIETAGRSSFVALSSAGSLAELRDRVAAFRRLDSVSSVDSALALIPDDQPAKQAILRDLVPIAPLRLGAAGSVDPDRLARALETLGQRLDLAVAEAPAGDDRQQIAALRDAAAALLAALRQTDTETAARALAPLQARLRSELGRALRFLQRNLDPSAIDIDTLPEALARRYVGRSGRLLIEVQPKIDIWERTGAERFVGQLRTVDPAVTGTPVIAFESIRYMERAYKQGTLYAFALVGLLGLLLIGRVRETLLSLLPLALGALWTVGLMALFDQPFNLANVFGFPLIIGAGAEFGMNVVLRRMEGEDRSGPIVPRSTALAVFVNGLTTVVGFGSMMVAGHRGIFGLGLTLTLGTIATLIAALVVLPAALRWSESVAEGEPALDEEPAFDPMFGAET